MPKFFSIRGFVGWTTISAILLCVCQAWIVGLPLFALAVGVWLRTGRQKVFQPAVQPMTDDAQQAAPNLRGPQIDDLAGCAGRLDPAWRAWLNEENQTD